MSTGRKIYFYPHRSFRDRQLDTVRHWGVPNDFVLNKDSILSHSGAQVSKKNAVATNISLSWKQVLPLINIKMRPKEADDAVVYLWGALLSHGPHIVEIDTPFALTGFNLRAFYLYRPLIRRLLLRDSCVEIRCISQACQNALLALLGERVAEKSFVVYPYISRRPDLPESSGEKVSFLFVGSQFEIKGGEALLAAFLRAYEENKNIALHVITHLPEKYKEYEAHEAISFYPSSYRRDEIGEQFMSSADVLLHPTYVDSLGMVVLEALSYGLAVVTTDNFALPEIVEDGRNGIILQSGYSHWMGSHPSAHQFDWQNTLKHISTLNKKSFIEKLSGAIQKLAQDKDLLKRYQQGSLDLLESKFSQPSYYK